VLLLLLNTNADKHGNVSLSHCLEECMGLNNILCSLYISSLPVYNWCWVASSPSKTPRTSAGQKQRYHRGTRMLRGKRSNIKLNRLNKRSVSIRAQNQAMVGKPHRALPFSNNLSFLCYI